MLGSHIGHDCKLGDNIIIANNSAIAGHVIIEDNVNIGGLVGVHQFCRMGEGSMIGAHAMVSKDIIPFLYDCWHATSAIRCELSWFKEKRE